MLRLFALSPVMLAAGMLIACCGQHVWGAPLALQLQKSSSGAGNALSGTTGSTVNSSVELVPGAYSCLSLEGVGNQNETFYAVDYDAAQLPDGTVLTLFNTSTCSQPLMTWSYFQLKSPYTVVPGVNSTGSSYVNQNTFLSLQFYVPLPGGPILDGYYQIFSGFPYTDFGNAALYEGCDQYLSASADNTSLSFAQQDDTSGLQQFLFQLVTAPDRYTISVPRGRNGVPGMLSSPACSEVDEEVTLVPYANATAETTWVLSSVGQNTDDTNFGFIANITSLARLTGACAANNATTLGVQPLPEPSEGYNYGTCQIEDNAFLVPGVNVTYGQDIGVNGGGWALLPVSPKYCYQLYGQCAPGEINFF